MEIHFRTQILLLHWVVNSDLVPNTYNSSSVEKCGLMLFRPKERCDVRWDLWNNLPHLFTLCIHKLLSLRANTLYRHKNRNNIFKRRNLEAQVVSLPLWFREMVYSFIHGFEPDKSSMKTVIKQHMKVKCPVSNVKCIQEA